MADSPGAAGARFQPRQLAVLLARRLRCGARSRSRQVVNFYSRVEGAAEGGRLLVKANQMLPPDIRIMRLTPAPPDFVARYSNTGACLSYGDTPFMLLPALAQAVQCPGEGQGRPV